MKNKKTQRNSKEKDIKERGFSFACRIVKLYQFLAKKKGGGEVLGRQVLRSGTSIGANLEEASAGQSRADFIFKCNLALKEARETYYWLRLLMTTQIVPANRLRQLANESDELVAILTTIVKKSRAR
jgi:four helix bundle protein